jgi:hypothetical protein
MPGRPLSQSYGHRGHILLTNFDNFMAAAFRS